jgi:AcrR family transcriptional regulator
MKEKTTYSKSKRTKQFIIETVAPIFNKKGYVGTSLSDITDATKLTKGSIYGNFKNKDEVAVEAFKYNLSISSYVFFMEIMKSDFTPLGKLRGLLSGFREKYERIVEIGGCPLLNTASDADDTHPQLKKMVQDTLLQIENTVIAVIKEGIVRGEIKKETDSKKMAGIIIALIEGSFMMAKLLGDRKYFDDSLGLLLEKVNEIEQ